MVNEPDATGAAASASGSRKETDFESVAQASDLEHPPAPESSPDETASSDETTSSDETGASDHHAGEVIHPEVQELEPWEQEEEGGGPVKTFLEHLEDLRWVIIKCVAAVVIGLVVCLVAANKIVEALDWPLKKAQQMLSRREQVVLFTMGSNVLWRLQKSDLTEWPVPLGSNRVETFNLQPVPVGSNTVAFALEHLAGSRKDAPPTFISIKTYTPWGPFSVAIQIAIYGGIGLASPFLLLFIGQFVIPALRRGEKKFLYQALGLGTMLFTMGVMFCYFIVLQVALNAAVLVSRWMTFAADEWKAEEYISFVCKLMLGMGLSFELPVVILTLVKIGLLDYHKLNKVRPYCVVGNMILATLITPDAISMLLMAIPLQVLFEISVLIARFWGRQKNVVEV